MNERQGNMIAKFVFNNWMKPFPIASAVVITAHLALPLRAASEQKSDSAATAHSKNQKQFSSAKEAADTLVRAAEVFDVAALREILGPEAADLITSADPIADKRRATNFATKAKEKTSLNVDPKNSKQT